MGLIFSVTMSVSFWTFNTVYCWTLWDGSNNKPLDLDFACPLDLYCSYTLDQILVALGRHTEKKRKHFQEGVLYLPDKGLDVFFVTLNKSDKDYSPSTMYRDYAINEEKFHWQSQSITSVESTTGQIH